MAEAVHEGGPVRLIRRYANRKLYDTEAGRLTSLHEIEDLIRAGTDIRVVDHSTGADITGELLVSILGSSVDHRADDVGALLSFIRSPGMVLSAMAEDEALADELRVIRERISSLSTTLDVLLENAAERASGPPPANGSDPRS